MQKTLKKLKVDKFWAIYLSVVLVCVAAIIIWLGQLNKMMVAYEASMPEHVAKGVAESLTNGDYKTLYRNLSADAQGESEAQFANYLSAKILSRQVEWAVGRTAPQGEKVFTLSAGGDAFAELTLMATDKVDAYGNHAWAVKTVSTPSALRTEYILTVPDESTVYADNQVLGAEYILEKDIPMDCAGHLPESKVHIPTWTKYRVVRSFSAPSFRVVDRDGNEMQIDKTDDGEYRCELPYSAAVRKSQGKRAVEIAKAYGKFSIGRLKKNAFLGYVLSGTDAYNMIYKYDERWFVKNSSYKFENVKAEKFYAYSKSCYSCEVTYDLVLKATNGKVETFPTKLTLYMYKTDKFKVYDMVIGQ